MAGSPNLLKSRNDRLRALAGTLLFVGVALACGRTAQAAEPRDVERQTREFNVSVDGTERGKCHMQIRRCDDGTERVRVDAAIRVNFIVYKYTYNSSADEVWKDDRLIALDGSANYNGAHYVVKAAPTDKGLRVTVNGHTDHADAESWATSYWRLPARLAGDVAPAEDAVIPAGAEKPVGKPALQKVSLLDADKGRTLHGQMHRVGEDTVVVAGKRLPCTRYRLTGDVQVDLWYDSARRLVRQESVESGHKTVLRLLRITPE
ncbi:MAG: DUF6134 family protein [Planctomycetaceae bacterium]